MVVERETVVARCNYIPNSLHELALFKGEKLTVVDSNGGEDWCRVRNAVGQTGVVPASHVKTVRSRSILGKLFGRSRKAGSTDKQALHITAPLMNNGGAAGTADEPSEGGYSASRAPGSPTPFHFSSQDPKANYFETPASPHNPMSSPPLQPEENAGGSPQQVAVVRYNYRAQRGDELELRVKEHITVLEKASDGWWRGSNGAGLTGWFPSNYVHQPASLLGSAIDVHQTASVPQSPAPSVAHAVAGAMSPRLNTRMGTATTNYQPQAPGELRLTLGEQIQLINECPHNPALWEARNDRGECGLVLKSLVRLAPPPPPHSSSSLLETSSAIVSPGTPAGGNGNMQPLELPPRTGPFKHEDWYFGRLVRNQCEMLFRNYGENGDFILRDSESNPGDYTLSLKADIKNRHFLVKQMADGTLEIGKKYFVCMEDLLWHYKTNAIFTDVNHTRLILKKPLRVPAGGGAVSYTTATAGY